MRAVAFRAPSSGTGDTAGRRPGLRNRSHGFASVLRLAVGQVDQRLGSGAQHDQEITGLTSVFGPEIQKAVGH